MADRNSSNRPLLFLVCCATILILAAVGLVWRLSCSNEPAFRGKSLSAWIVPFCVQTRAGFSIPAGPANFDKLEPVRHAVTEIGTNGLPFLIAKLNRRESAIHRRLREWSGKQPIAGLRLTDPRVGRVRAIRALAVLGPAARPAIPELISQLPDSLLAPHAIYALQATGVEGMQALVNELTNRNTSVHMQIESAIMISGLNSAIKMQGVSRSSEINVVPSDVAVAGLCGVARNPVSVFRHSAIMHLGMMGSAASNAVPVLLELLDDTNRLVRSMAIRSLGRIHAQPDLVIPVLTNRLDAADGMTQMDAYLALREYGYNAPFPMPGRSFSATSPPRMLLAPTNLPIRRLRARPDQSAPASPWLSPESN